MGDEASVVGMEEDGVAAYTDFCTGIRKHAMIIEEVHFADGSKWEFKQSRDQKDN